MEYTDAPTEPQQISDDTMQCPYCGTWLPKNAESCTRCDWTCEATTPAEPKASDAMAILLSIIPGLGHIYKGHRVMGALILFLITPTAIAFGGPDRDTLYVLEGENIYGRKTQAKGAKKP